MASKKLSSGMAEKRTDWLGLRLPESKKQEIRETAQKKGMQMSTYLLMLHETMQRGKVKVRMAAAGVIECYHVDDLGADGLRGGKRSLKR